MGKVAEVKFLRKGLQKEKTIEVRKDYPKASDWNKVTPIYCSKNRKSFNRIKIREI